MSLKPVRQYFKDRIFELDKDYQEHTDAFNTENISQLRFNKAYHIFYGNIQTTTANQLSTLDTVSATVSLFQNGYRDPIIALDDAMDFANKFRLRCLNPKYSTRNFFIKNVVCNTINAEPVNTNDNSIIIRLQFSITVIFGTQINLDI